MTLSASSWEVFRGYLLWNYYYLGNNLCRLKLSPYHSPTTDLSCKYDMYRILLPLKICCQTYGGLLYCPEGKRWGMRRACSNWTRKDSRVAFCTTAEVQGFSQPDAACKGSRRGAAISSHPWCYNQAILRPAGPCSSLIDQPFELAPRCNCVCQSHYEPAKSESSLNWYLCWTAACYTWI
jgi:hypothetical protein